MSNDSNEIVDILAKSCIIALAQFQILMFAGQWHG